MSVAAELDEHAGEHRVDVRAARGDELDCADDLRERCLLEHEPARPCVERLRQERPVAEGGVEDHRRVGCGAADVPRDLDPGQAGHAQVEDRDGRLAELDLLDRVLAVAGAPAISIPCSERTSATASTTAGWSSATSTG